MYSNYQLPYNYSMRPNSSSSINRPYSQSYNNNDRIIGFGGGFLGPFLLGGLAGAAIAPGFYGRPRPYYYNNYYYYPYPPYYYRPY